MKIIGVVTSGGDAPGMNAAIRGVVPGGTTSQAWSVAEVLRILDKHNIIKEKHSKMNS